MARTSGQELAIRQLRSIELASPLGLEIVDIGEPSAENPRMWARISLDCAGIEHDPSGIQLHERERISIGIDPDFPFDSPATWVRHGRWAGTPHVQWRRFLCLYAAPAVEWNPAGAMYSYIERLFQWLERAAAGTLDPEGAPLHPPVAYTTPGAPLVIPRTDAPEVGDGPWLGYVEFEHRHDRRYDLFGWIPDYDPGGKLNDPPERCAPAVLLNEQMDWEFPRSVAELLLALKERGVSIGLLIGHLGFAAAFREAGQPLLVVVGTPMRGIAGGTLRQHLTAWRIPSEEADKMTLTLRRFSEDDAKRDIGEKAIDAVFEWAGSAQAEWCPVREARHEVTVRRDEDSPLRAFTEKTVAVWGCGALGGPIAEWVLRAGAHRVLLYDSATVTPGVLVRQPYGDNDLGSGKATALAARLKAIDPTASIEPHFENVLSGPLEREGWHDGADVVIDATASVAVQSKLERARRLDHQDTTVITTIIGHTAQHGIATISFPGHSGAGADTLRATKLACARTPRLRGFLQEFWPDPPRTDFFQPEPGCSSPTFQGSGAEVNALAANLLTSVAGDLAAPPETDTAVAHLLALPAAPHPGSRAARLSWTPALTMADAAGRFELRIAEVGRREILAWTKSAERRLPPMSETGGVLFGLRDEAAGVIWIDEVSGPPPDSVETPDEFLCGTDGVAELAKEKSERTTGSVDFLGMWHTHPGQSPAFSPRDLVGMLELLDASASPSASGLILIVGWAASEPRLGAYVFEHDELRRDQATINIHEPQELDVPTPSRRDVGRALSGGGSRAIAFHLGCLRALHDRGVLDRVRVVSGVSGGSVIAAMWSYWPDEDFFAFEARVLEVLGKGLQGSVARRFALGPRGPQALASALIAGGSANAVRAASATRQVVARGLDRLPPAAIDPPLRRWVSRTDAFEDALVARLFGEKVMPDARRGDVDVILNACDLRTGSAFRFGSQESGTWRLGVVPQNPIPVATAVAASAAYPLLLPAMDRTWEFERRGEISKRRIVLTDGGVFDNLGTSCLEPGRSAEFSTNVVPVDYIVACDAGRGLLAPNVPFGWTSRLSRSFEATFRKVQDGARGRLHAAVAGGELKGFVIPYLGQLDQTLPAAPPDLVPRETVNELPTNFAAMPAETIDVLARRGEQLTRHLVDAHCPQL
jgi:predicted acylesterase/phospholipase RssA/molybdopterin/thiamine biosynthesis adenylyltransferase